MYGMYARRATRKAARMHCSLFCIVTRGLIARAHIWDPQTHQNATCKHASMQAAEAVR